MAGNSCFQKIVGPMKQGANFISKVVIVIAAVAFIFPPILLVWLFGEEIPQVYDDDTDTFMFGISAILYIFVDPLFLYVPLINEETKCVMLDNRLKIAAIIMRSFGDLRYVLRIYLRIQNGQLKSLKEIAMSVTNVTVSILPIPQVVILVFLPKMTGSRSLKIMKFLYSLIILQYLPRLYPFFKMCKQVNRDMLNLFKKKIKETPNNRSIEIPKWFGIAVNILGYILASHVLGAFWYFFSIQREIDCWGYACRIENGCEFGTSCVKKTFRNISHIKNSCPVNPPNATVFDFGIFLYALQSGMQGSTNLSEKFLQCFSWGLRNLSSFASNLNSSTYGWENLFVAVISISGLVLFMYLLGHSQTYMQETDKSERIKRKMKIIVEPKVRSLLSDYCLPSEMELIIKRAVVLIIEKDEDFIVENMFSILSFNLPDEQDYKESLDLKIKLNLFLDKLKKVERLKDKDKKLLEKICQHLEPMIYTEGSYIIREGEPLDMMFFVTQGTVLTYVTINEREIKVNEKDKDSLYGEELLTLAKWTSSKLSSLPISTVSVKSYKKVEVFALNAADLQNIVSEFPSYFNTGPNC